MTSASGWRSWLVPPSVSNWAGRRLSRQPLLDDRVGSWETAVSQSSGYDQHTIVEKVFESTSAVLRGEAAFERDSVTFPDPQYRWPVIAGLLSVAAREGELRVIDFGGSLGSTYWQHRHLLDGIHVRWAVVEQENFIQLAHKLDQRDVNFYHSIDSAVRDISPNVILLSSVLQYLPEPENILQKLLKSPASTLIIDRTPMADIQENIACLQVVPPSIYPASYPAWIVSRRWLESELHGWEIIADFEGIEPDGVTPSGIAFSWDGLIARRKAHD